MAEEREGSFGPLLDRAQNGDESALGELLEGNREWLRRNAEQAVSNKFQRRQDASDLTQECLTAASQQIENFRGTDVSTFRGWLRAIQRNLIRRLVRSHAGKIEQECDLPQSTNGGIPLDGGHTPLMARVEQREAVGWLWEAITHLEEEDRKLVQKRFFAEQEGITYEELAQEFQCSAPALRKRLSRLLQKLESGIRLLKEMQRCQFPDAQRNMLCLQHFRGWSAEQIGQELGAPEDTIKRILVQAERELKAFGEHSQ